MAHGLFYIVSIQDHIPNIITDRMKIMDADTNWGTEDSWLQTDFILAGGDYSPSMQNDGCIGTISPSEIHMQHPSSGGFASPYSNFDSPSEGYETSPLFATDDVASSDDWFPLFTDQVAEPGRSVQHPVHAENTPSAECASPTSTESPGTSPRLHSSSSGSAKRSSTSGVRKRSQRLPPIIVDNPNDTVAVKRARNTLAARKSRAKKAEKMEDMEVTIQQLREQVEYWKNKCNAQD